MPYFISRGNNDEMMSSKTNDKIVGIVGTIMAMVKI